MKSCTLLPPAELGGLCQLRAVEIDGRRLPFDFGMLLLPDENDGHDWHVLVMRVPLQKAFEIATPDGGDHRVTILLDHGGRLAGRATVANFRWFLDSLRLVGTSRLERAEG